MHREIFSKQIRVILKYGTEWIGPDWTNILFRGTDLNEMGEFSLVPMPLAWGRGCGEFD